MPLYIMITMLVLEKIAQRWQYNRYDCTKHRIREFKILEEQIKLINVGKEDIRPEHSDGKSPEEYLKLHDEKMSKQ